MPEHAVLASTPGTSALTHAARDSGTQLTVPRFPSALPTVPAKSPSPSGLAAPRPLSSQPPVFLSHLFTMHQEGQDGRRRRKKRFFLIFPNLPCSIIKSKKGSAIFLWDSLSDSHKDHSATAQERLKKIPSCPLGQLKRFRQWLQGFQGYAPVFPLTLAFPSWADIYPTHMLSVVWLHRNSTAMEENTNRHIQITDGK